MGHHDHGRLRRQTVFNGAQHEGLRAAAGSAGAGEARGLHVRKRSEKIQGADTVPSLQPHQVDVPELVDGVGRKPAVTARKNRFRFARACVVGEEGVLVAHHVIGKSHASLAGETDAPGRNTPIGTIGQAATGPMAVGIEDPRKRTRPPAPRPIQIAADIKSGRALKHDFFHGVTLAFETIEHPRPQRSFFGHRPQPATDQDLLPDFARPGLPFVQRSDGRKGAGGVEGANLIGGARRGHDQAGHQPGKNKSWFHLVQKVTRRAYPKRRMTTSAGILRAAAGLLFNGGFPIRRIPGKRLSSIAQIRSVGAEFLPQRLGIDSSGGDSGAHGEPGGASGGFAQRHTGGHHANGRHGLVRG
ncbi:MAG: hypothetical protein BWX84_00326 [Verrucomicrobia bacterium ADurb.Bin118]|nr:MAG: hypothetical protein BWX84_00326 [Verrucomicrobia bacterium ADurb.Bin118]